MSVTLHLVMALWIVFSMIGLACCINWWLQAVRWRGVCDRTVCPCCRLEWCPCHGYLRDCTPPEEIMEHVREWYPHLAHTALLGEAPHLDSYMDGTPCVRHSVDPRRTRRL